MYSKRDIRYEIGPENIDRGIQWLAIRIKNMGDGEFNDVKVRLNSMDTSGIQVKQPYQFIPTLNPDESVKFHIPVRARNHAYVYMTLEAKTREGNSISWESIPVRINVGDMPAELDSIALAYSSDKGQKSVSVDVHVKAHVDVKSLLLEIWVEGLA